MRPDESTHRDVRRRELPLSSIWIELTVKHHTPERRSLFLVCSYSHVRSRRLTIFFNSRAFNTPPNVMQASKRSSLPSNSMLSRHELIHRLMDF